MGISEVTLLSIRCQHNITAIPEARGNSHSKLEAYDWIEDWGEATYLGTSFLQGSSSTSPGSAESPVSSPVSRPAAHAARMKEGNPTGLECSPSQSIPAVLPCSEHHRLPRKRLPTARLCWAGPTFNTDLQPHVVWWLCQVFLNTCQIFLYIYSKSYTWIWRLFTCQTACWQLN